MKIIFDFNRTLYNPHTGELYAGVISLLSRLAKQHELFLVSRNKPGRDSTLEQLGIREYFQRIVFTNKKTEAVFSDLADNTTDLIVVGDRLSEEISIGNRLGFITIYVKQGLPENSSEKADYTVENMQEIENIIKTYGK